VVLIFAEPKELMGFAALFVSIFVKKKVYFVEIHT